VRGKHTGTDGRRTDALREPFRAQVCDVVWAPSAAGKVGRALVRAGVLDELRVHVRVAERARAHEVVVEVARTRSVALERVELRELRLAARGGQKR
jgi:hypothetical protein